MAKLGAVAILAMATFVNSVSADAGCAKNDGEAGRCFGPEDSQNKMCCEGYKCIQKDQYYGECLPDDAEVPADWDGKEIGSESMGQPPMSEDDPMMDDDDAMEEDAEEEDAMKPDAMEEEDMEGDAMGPAVMEGDDMEEEDMEEGAPAPAKPIVPGDDRYIAVIAKDYIPSMANNISTPNAVMIEDISGHAVKNQKGCEDLCSTTAECNLASFYLDSSSFTGAEDKNCWLKIIEDSCELPSDALDDPNAILLLKVDECPDAEELIDAMDVMDAEGPEAIGPDAVGPEADAPIDDEITAIAPRGGLDLGDDIASPEAEGTPAGAVSVRGAFAALVIAAAGVTLLF